MNSTELLRKIIALEKSIGTANNTELRQQVYEVEDYLMQLQREHAQGLFKDSWGGALHRLHSQRRVSQGQ
jgi:hypothetical protein